MIASIV